MEKNVIFEKLYELLSYHPYRINFPWENKCKIIIFDKYLEKSDCTPAAASADPDMKDLNRTLYDAQSTHLLA